MIILPTCACGEEVLAGFDECPFCSLPKFLVVMESEMFPWCDDSERFCIVTSNSKATWITAFDSPEEAESAITDLISPDPGSWLVTEELTDANIIDFTTRPKKWKQVKTKYFSEVNT